MAEKDPRLTQIKEGAGLEESRLNTEFIAFVRKWGSWALLAVAAVMFVIYGLNHLEQRKADRIDAAFQQYESAAQGSNPSPQSLIDVAQQHSSIPGVRMMATLTAADLYLRSAVSGVKVFVSIIDMNRIQIRSMADIEQLQALLANETTLNSDGSAKSPDHLLTAEERTTYLSEARRLYQQVVDGTASMAGQELAHLSALFGLSSVAETEGDWASSRAALERARAYAEQADLVEFVSTAQRRLASLDGLSKVDALPARSQVWKPAPPAMPEATLGPTPDAGAVPAGTEAPVGTSTPAAPQDDPSAEPTGTPATAPAQPPADPPAEPAQPTTPPPTDR